MNNILLTVLILISSVLWILYTIGIFAFETGAKEMKHWINRLAMIITGLTCAGWYYQKELAAIAIMWLSVMAIQFMPSENEE